MRGAGGFVDLKLGHYHKDGIEVVDVGGEIDIYTAPRLRELLIDLVSKRSYQLVVNLDKVEFLDSTRLGVLVGGLRRAQAHASPHQHGYNPARIHTMIPPTWRTRGSSVRPAQGQPDDGATRA